MKQFCSPGRGVFSRRGWIDAEVPGRGKTRGVPFVRALSPRPSSVCICAAIPAPGRAVLNRGSRAGSTAFIICWRGCQKFLHYDAPPGTRRGDGPRFFAEIVSDPNTCWIRLSSRIRARALLCEVFGGNVRHSPFRQTAPDPFLRWRRTPQRRDGQLSADDPVRALDDRNRVSSLARVLKLLPVYRWGLGRIFRILFTGRFLLFIPTRSASCFTLGPVSTAISTRGKTFVPGYFRPIGKRAAHNGRSTPWRRCV